ncbi:MAG: sulfite exporter TauE/SafE family protein [Hyphomicrobiaceae bacterium]
MLIAWLLVLGIGLAAGTLAGVIGFGGSTILLPVLTLVFGPKAAVPIMAIAAILGNLSRVAVWWREIRWSAALAYSVGAMPMAWLGARTMLAMNPTVLELFLGIFFIAMIPLRRWLERSGFSIGLCGLAMAGAGVGYLTGIVANTGPINTPFFLAHGLVRGGFVGTEALSSLSMYGTKVTAFRLFGALPAELIINGVIVGTSLMLGAYLAKRLMVRLGGDAFRGLMDGLLLVTGASMIVGAIV